MIDFTFGCSICRDRPMEFAHYFDKFHAPGIADRMQALHEGRDLDYARLVAPGLAKQIVDSAEMASHVE